MFYDYTNPPHSSRPNMADNHHHNSANSLIHKENKGMGMMAGNSSSFFIGTSSPEAQIHNLVGVEAPLFRDDIMGGEPMSDWHQLVQNN